MIQPGPTPRVQGRYFVVSPGTVFPKICVRTGRQDDLIEINEHVRTSPTVEMTSSMLGALFASQRAPVCYYIQRAEFGRLKHWRRLCSVAMLVAVGILVLGVIVRSQNALIIGVGAICALFAAYLLLPSPLSVAAVWGNQVFLLKIPPEIIAKVMGGRE